MPFSKIEKQPAPLPVSIDKITLADGFIHAYTDGSCSYNNKLLGLGVVIPTNNHETKIIFSKRVKPERDFDLRRFGAMRSEFMATTYALKAMPEGANVHLYTDHPILRRVLNRYIDSRKMLWRPRHSKKHSPEFVEMVNELKDQLDTLGEIKVTQLNDTLSRRMQLAHKAAARGSGASGIKVRIAKNPPPSNDNPFFAGDPREDDRDKDNDSNPYNPTNPLDKITFD